MLAPEPEPQKVYLSEQLDKHVQGRIQSAESGSVYNSYTSFNKHFAELFKHHTIEDITIAKMTAMFETVRSKLLAENLNHDYVIENGKKILTPFFNELISDEVDEGLDINPILTAKFQKKFPKAVTTKASLDVRLAGDNSFESFTNFAQELYIKSMSFEQELQRTTGYDDDIFRACFLIGAMCGRRAKEYIRRLEWKDVDLEYKTIIARKTKSKKIEKYSILSTAELKWAV